MSMGHIYMCFILLRLIIAQNQSFVQKEIGVKYKTIHIWSYPQNLAIPCYY